MDASDIVRINEERKQWAFLRATEASDLKHLLAHTKDLMYQEGGNVYE